MPARVRGGEGGKLLHVRLASASPPLTDSLGALQAYEEKEAALKRVLSAHYAQIRTVEQELSSLRNQVLLTSQPKRVAIEHLRHLIEAASEECKRAKARHAAALAEEKKAAAVLAKAEEVKATLAEDLRLLVQQDTDTAFERLDHLTSQLDGLLQSTPGVGQPPQPPQQQQQQQAALETMQQAQERGLVGAEGGGEAAPQGPPQTPEADAKAAAAAAAAAEAEARRREAAEAKARHVNPLGGRRPRGGASNGGGQRVRPAPAPRSPTHGADGRFAGFD